MPVGPQLGRTWKALSEPLSIQQLQRWLWTMLSIYLCQQSTSYMAKMVWPISLLLSLVRNALPLIGLLYSMEVECSNGTSGRTLLAFRVKGHIRRIRADAYHRRSVEPAFLLKDQHLWGLHEFLVDVKEAKAPHMSIFVRPRQWAFNSFFFHRKQLLSEAYLKQDFTMEHKLLILFFLSASLFMRSLSLKPSPGGGKLRTNITIIGSVFCDACSEHTFSKHSYFLQGVQVLIQCKFAANSMTSRDEISISAERKTDVFGVYKLDLPPVEGFQCQKGLEIKSVCAASLLQSSSSTCSIPGLQSSTAHMAIKSKARDICILNLNTLNYHPGKRDGNLCGAEKRAVAASLAFWPSFPHPFGLP
ncbi:hypothetical protein AXF42_Ash004806 [Apostasia shenzhenica]|uniref:Pollen-specific protein-like n=1 Tax=Apostasia shenzhenica TaxID=1088818 RepID=A0A2I0B7L7_9ASPA|nr:hypothetical protein AXF42_Ash004806 [Apostasia shenzhenica]